MQQEGASAEIQVTLAGTSRISALQAEKSAATRRGARNRAKSALLPRHFAKRSRIAPTMLNCISICPWLWQGLGIRALRT